MKRPLRLLLILSASLYAASCAPDIAAENPDEGREQTGDGGASDGGQEQSGDGGASEESQGRTGDDIYQEQDEWVEDDFPGAVTISFTAVRDAFDPSFEAADKWAPGAVVGVSEKTSGARIYRFRTEGGGREAVFTGKVPEGFKAGKAFYPYSAIMANSSANNFRVEGVPATMQKGVRDGLVSRMPLTAAFDDINAGPVVFHHLSSLVKVTVRGGDVSSVMLETTGADIDEKCRGGLSLPSASFANVGTSSLVFNCAYRASKAVTMVPATGGAFAPGDYHFVIMATAEANPRILRELSVTYVRTGGEKRRCALAQPLTILPGRVYRMPGDDLSGTVVGADPEAAVIGRRIPAWKEGCFDIHFINTMAGECAFLIFPDGTQMLIDSAGSLNDTGPVNSTTNEGIRVRWDPTKESAYNFNTLIEEYIHNCMAWTRNDTIDYMLVTHFHSDHMGSLSGRDVSVRCPDYKQSSMPYMLDGFAVGKTLDRGYPDYDYPYDMASRNSNVRNWKAAVSWHIAHTGLKAEKVKAGASGQVTLLRDASRYPGFTVRNIGVNGEIWTGSGDTAVKTFPSLSEIVSSDPSDPPAGDNCPAENHNSAVLKFTYGPFDYWAGGDMQYNGMSYHPWKDIETPMAKACGQVDVMKADHHGTVNTNGSGYKASTGAVANAIGYLRPRCWIVNNWVDGQPRKATFEGVLKVCPDADIFITNTCALHKTYKGYDKALKGADGHIVVRVADGGKSYCVYTLNDRDRSMTVKAISGPYQSR